MRQRLITGGALLLLMMNVKVTRHWQLSEDGKSLTVDIAVEGRRGVR